MPDTILVQVEQPVARPFLSRVGYRVLCILIAVDVLVNALAGGDAYQTMSCRVGRKMSDPKSRLSRWTWPGWWRRHCMTSVYQAWV